MKTTKNVLTATLLLLLFAAGCDENMRSNGGGNTGNEKPIEIPFTEYSLDGTSCQWANFTYPPNGELIIINSTEELEKHVVCVENNYPVIDFSKQTLLLGSGNAEKVVHTITKSLLQLSTNKYKLNIEIILSEALVALPTTWVIALVTDKLSEESNVELKIIM